VRNPDYWKPGLPYLDGVRLQNLSDDATAWAAFLANQIDLITNPLRGDEAKKLFDEQEGKPYTAQWYKDVSYTAVQQNLRRKPFDDSRVYKAVRLLVDHEEATNQWAVTWFGRGYLSAYMPAALEDWDFTEQEHITKFLEFKRPKDDAVREAHRLLGAAGFTRDNPLRTSMNGYDSATAQAQAVLHQAQINKFGQSVIQVPDLKLFSVAQSNSILAQGDFDIFSGNIVPPQPYDVDSWFTTMYVSNGGRNNGKWSDSKMDQMIDQQRTIFNIAQRKAFVKEMITYMMENAPYTSWSGRYLLSVGQLKVKDWAPEGSSAVWGYNFERVWLDT
jgi:peptide/nickel transport system substrate-binding protein